MIESKLKEIVNSAKSCLDLTRLLTEEIFFKESLVKYFISNKHAFRPDVPLSDWTVDIVVKFVLLSGRTLKLNS